MNGQPSIFLQETDRYVTHRSQIDHFMTILFSPLQDLLIHSPAQPGSTVSLTVLTAPRATAPRATTAAVGQRQPLLLMSTRATSAQQATTARRDRAGRRPVVWARTAQARATRRSRTVWRVAQGSGVETTTSRPRQVCAGLYAG